MTDKEITLGEAIRSFKPVFWLASFMELMERWAWYGMFGVLSLYLVASTDEGGLGFNHTDKASIMGNVTAILYFLPLFLGVIADRIGYKLSLIIAYVIMIVGYYFMGNVSTYWSFYFLFLLVALGAAMFKPVASAIVSKSTNKDNGTIGFGIFYMMVNIGGFVGPASSSYLRTTYGWKLIFIQAAVVITINLIMVLFFFKEPERQVYKKESVGTEIANSLKRIWEALKDTKLTVLLILMVGFWTMFNQLFYTLPNFITDWVNSAPLNDWIQHNLPFLSKIITENGQVKAEWFTNIDALMIVFLQIGVSYFATKMRHVSAMIRGFIIAAIGIGLTFYTHNYMFTIIGTVIFAIGEMTTNPTFSSFIALISPKGKEALYQGTYFLPVAVGNFLTQFISGNLYGKWSDKFSLCQRYMAEKGIAMPQVINDFIKINSKKLGMGEDVFKTTFHIEKDNVDWIAILEKIQIYAQQHNVNLGTLQVPVTKNQYYQLATEKLHMSQSQITEMLWSTYSPNKIWFVIVGIGVITIIALSIYDKMVIRPREKKA